MKLRPILVVILSVLSVLITQPVAASTVNLTADSTTVLADPDVAGGSITYSGTESLDGLTSVKFMFTNPAGHLSPAGLTFAITVNPGPSNLAMWKIVTSAYDPGGIKNGIVWPFNGPSVTTGTAAADFTNGSIAEIEIIAFGQTAGVLGLVDGLATVSIFAYDQATVSPSGPIPLPAAVPLPAAAFLLLGSISSLGGLGMYRRRRARGSTS